MPRSSLPSRPKPPKHPHAQSSSAQRARPSSSKPSRPQASRPSPASSAATTNPPFRLSLSAQNSILDHFATVFAPLLRSSSLPAQIQALKGRLYDRDFDAVFRSPENRAAYAARWSPSRALACAELVARVPELARVLGGGDVGQRQLSQREDGEPAEQDEEGDAAEGGATKAGSRTVTCLGAGAGAELVGLVSAMRVLRPAASLTRRGQEDRAGALDLRMFDVADWRHVLGALEGALARPRNVEATNDTPCTVLRVEFDKQDVLEPECAALEDAFRASALVTVMFTLNELFAASLAQTTALLLQLGSTVRVGTLLLVVDSPGSYSTVQLSGAREGRSESSEGKAEAEKRRYPMQWLLDRVLLGTKDGRAKSGKVEPPIWRKVLHDDARWFRKAEGVAYPIELEDMRYQLHLYERM